MQQYREAYARSIIQKYSVSAPVSKPAAVARLMTVIIAVGRLLPAVAGHAADVPAVRSTWRAEKEVFYLVFVRSFADSNGDRVGDFRGIEQKLPYLQALDGPLIWVRQSPPATNSIGFRRTAVDPEVASGSALVKTNLMTSFADRLTIQGRAIGAPNYSLFR